MIISGKRVYKRITKLMAVDIASPTAHPEGIQIDHSKLNMSWHSLCSLKPLLTSSL